MDASLSSIASFSQAVLDIKTRSQTNKTIYCCLSFEKMRSIIFTCIYIFDILNRGTEITLKMTFLNYKLKVSTILK